MNKQLAITLADTKVEFLEISKCEVSEEAERLDLSYSAQSVDGNSKMFVLTFDVKIYHNQNMLFKIIFNANFKTDVDIDEEFMVSPFIKIGAPAIGYPYLRAYVSTLMTISGYNPLILPTINFTEEPEKSRLEE